MDARATLMEILRREEQTAMEQLASSGWDQGGHNLGRDVQTVVRMTTEAMDEVPPDASGADWVRAVEHARDDYRDSQEDPEGAGEASFERILAELGRALSG